MRRLGALVWVVLVGCAGVDKGPGDRGAPGGLDTGDTGSTDTGSTPEAPCYRLWDSSGGELGGAAELQAALDLAPDGGTVTVCAGVHDGDLEISKSVSLLSEAGPEQTVLQGTGASSVLRVSGGDVLLSGFTLTGGVGSAHPAVAGGAQPVGGCINGMDALTLRVSDAVVEGCVADWGGGVMGSDAGRTELSGVTVRDNHAEALGGGVWLREGAIQDSVITGNTAPYAGGVAVRRLPTGPSGVVDLGVTVIEDNDGDVQGGGLHVAGPSDVTGGVIRANRSQMGAGVHAYTHSGILTGLTVDGNTATVGGGGLLLEGATPTLVGLTISGNVATGEALPEAESVAGGVWVANADATLDGCTVLDNAAGWGGGVMVTEWSEPGEVHQTTFVDTVLIDNTAAAQAGGVAIHAASLVLMGGAVTGNQAPMGGGAYLSLGSLEAEGADWGAGDQDNAPTDVEVAEGEGVESVDAGILLRCSTDAGGCEVDAGP